jgi:hypothetical protein
MTPTGACDTRRHPLLSLDSYCLQIPALCQYSRDQTQFNSIAPKLVPLSHATVPLVASVKKVQEVCGIGDFEGETRLSSGGVAGKGFRHNR